MEGKVMELALYTVFFFNTCTSSLFFQLKMLYTNQCFVGGKIYGFQSQTFVSFDDNHLTDDDGHTVRRDRVHSCFIDRGHGELNSTRSITTTTTMFITYVNNQMLRISLISYL